MIRFRKIEIDLRKKIPRFTGALKKRKEINAVYLFGSYAKNKVLPLSDIDIAILLRKGIPKAKYWDYKLDLLSVAVKILGTEEIDFVVLQEAPFELAYHILRDGKLLFCRDQNEKNFFQERTVRDYLDTQPIREETYFHLKERLQKGRFAHDTGKYKQDIENARRLFEKIRTYS